MIKGKRSGFIVVVPVRVLGIFRNNVALQPVHNRRIVRSYAKPLFACFGDNVCQPEAVSMKEDSEQINNNYWKSARCLTNFEMIRG